MTESFDDEQSAPSDSVFHRAEDGILFVLVAALVILSCSQILLRNWFEVTFLWIDSLARHLVLWSSFLGALVATREAQHVKIDAVLRMLPPVGRRFATAFGDFVAAGVCGVLTFISIRFVTDERLYAGQTFLDIPQWWLHLIFPIAFSGMTIRFMLAAGRRLLTQADNG